jgi:ribonuclease HI
VKLETDDDDELELISGKAPTPANNRDTDAAPPAKKRRSTGNLAERELNETPGPPDTSEKKPSAPSKPRAANGVKKSPVLRIYTDGSALSNGQSGSNAGVGVWFGDHDTRYPSSFSLPLPILY